jgi:hypothetical protein
MPHVVPPAAHTPIDVTDDRARLDLTDHPDLRSVSHFLMAMRLRR